MNAPPSLPARGPGAGAATAAGVLALAALAGSADATLHGRGLSPVEALATVGLWVAAAAPVALALGLGAAALARLAPRALGSSGAAAAALCATVQLGAVGALALGQATPAAAAAASVAALVAFALRPRRAAWLGPLRRASLAALAVAAASAAFAATRHDGASSAAPRAPSATPVAAPPRAAPSDAGRPRHVVLIVLDTLRADHLGAYGRGDGLSPAFDALATEGTLFEHCFAPASWTVPSHASLFTGLPPRSHGASFEAHRWLDDDFTTLAETLAAAGWRTAGFAANEHVALSNLHQGFETWETLGAPFRALTLRRPLQLLGAPSRWADEGAADAVSRIEAYLAQAGDRPQFLFVNLLEPHWRYLPPLESRLGAVPADQGLLEATRRAARFYGPLAMARGQVPEATAAAVRALYAAEVRYQDGRLGALLRVLDRHLDLDRTLLVLTADHGENLGEGGRWDHVFALNDALIHVPLLIRAPGRFPAGAREGGLCSLLDVPATVGDALGVALDPGAGRSLVPGHFQPRSVVVAEGDPFYGHLERMSFETGLQHDVARYTAFLRAARDERFKLVTSSRAAPVLYDLETDPDETRDVSDAHPGEVRRLQDALRRFDADNAPYRSRDAGAGGLSAAERERLEALGYVQ